MSYSSRRPWLASALSPSELYRVPSRYLRTSSDQESEFEKPYVQDEYELMQLTPPLELGFDFDLDEIEPPPFPIIEIPELEDIEPLPEGPEPPDIPSPGSPPELPIPPDLPELPDIEPPGPMPIPVIPNITLPELGPLMPVPDPMPVPDLGDLGDGPIPGDNDDGGGGVGLGNGLIDLSPPDLPDFPTPTPPPDIPNLGGGNPFSDWGGLDPFGDFPDIGCWSQGNSPEFNPFPNNEGLSPGGLTYNCSICRITCIPPGFDCESPVNCWFDMCLTGYEDYAGAQIFVGGSIGSYELLWGRALYPLVIYPPFGGWTTNTPVSVTLVTPTGAVCNATVIVEGCGGCNCDTVTHVSWDSTISSETITQSGNATVAVKDGCPPYQWQVSGTDFSFDNAVTQALTNSLVAGSSACGTATVTVTDNCGQTATGYVRCTTGDWYTYNSGVCSVSCSSPYAGCNPPIGFSDYYDDPGHKVEILPSSSGCCCSNAGFTSITCITPDKTFSYPPQCGTQGMCLDYECKAWQC